ncbi:MAG: hypothetical protein ACXAB2_03700 [Candidatus Hodarchaeales archaeon]|jgi:hypothetical protein
MKNIIFTLHTKRRLSNQLCGLVLVVIIMLVGFTSQWGNQRNITEAKPAQTQNELINGLFAPRIDGFMDSNNQTGYLTEWGDAKSIRQTLISSSSDLDVEIYSKYVSDILYVGFSFSKALDIVSFQVDRDNDDKLSDGDVLLSFDHNGQFAVQIYENSESIPLAEFLGLNTSIPGLEITTLLQVGSIVFDSPFTSQTVHVEIAFSYLGLDDLLVKYGKSTFVSHLMSQKNEEANSGEIHYNVIVETADGEIFGIVEQPHVVEGVYWAQQYFRVDAIFVKFMFADVGIDHIELTQAVQDEDNSLPLVLNKDSLVRVFVSNPSASTINVEVTIRVYFFFLVGIALLGTLSQTFSAPPEPLDRDEIDDSANFELPDAWEGVPILYIEAEVHPIGRWDFNSLNNQGSDWWILEETYDLNVHYIRLVDSIRFNPFPFIEFRQVTTATAANALRSLTDAYPMANPNYMELDWDLLGIYGGTSEGIVLTLNFISWIIRTFTSITSDQIFAITRVGYPTSSGFTIGGVSDPPWGSGSGLSFAGWGSALTSSSRELVMAHEMDHNIGPAFGYGTGEWARHIQGACGATGTDPDWAALFADDDIHEPGWFPGATQMVPSNKPDFMGYCNQANLPTKWVSDYRWPRLYDRLRRFRAESPAPSLKLLGIDQQPLNSSVRIIQGYIYDDMSADLLPSIELPTTTLMEDQLSTPHGDWLTNLSVHYINGSSQQHPIYSNFVGVEGGVETRSGFTFMLRDEGEITKVEITDTVNGSVLAQFEDTGFTVDNYSITIPSTISRDAMNTISWDLSLTNTTNIYTHLQYSSNGEDWFPLGVPSLDTSRNVTFTTLPGGNQASVRLVATDGVKTSIVHSLNFAVPDLPPRVEISRGSIPSTVATGSSISLFGRAHDVETGLMANSSLTWELSRSGVEILSTTGAYLSTRLFDLGIHKIKITATDPAGSTASQTVEVNVIRPAYLEVSVWEDFQTLLQGMTTTTTGASIAIYVSVFALLLLSFVTVIQRRKHRKVRS